MPRSNTPSNESADSHTEFVDAVSFCSLLVSSRHLTRSIDPTSATRALRDADTGDTFIIRQRDLDVYLSKRRGAVAV